jgi:hypothetical protein
MLDIDKLLQPCVDNLVTCLLYHGCKNLLAQPCNNLLMPSSLLQVELTACYKLVATTGNKQCKHNLLTACEQTCNNLFADLLQAVRFYACNM